MVNPLEAAKIYQNPEVYVFPSLWGRPLIGVVCDNPKDRDFQDSAVLMQEHCRATKPLVHEDWDRSSATQEGVQGEVRKLAALLHALDGTNYSMWNFSVCTVSDGPFEGTRAIAIGSNTKKRARAGNLAMALAGACDVTGSSRETLGSLFSILVPAVHKALKSTYFPCTQVREEYRNSQAETAAPTLMIPPPPPPPPPPPAVRRANTFSPVAVANVGTPPRSDLQARTRASSVSSNESENVVFCGLESSAHITVSVAAAWLGPDTNASECLTPQGYDREVHHQETTLPLQFDHVSMGSTQPHEDYQGFVHLQYGLSSKAAEDALTIATFGSKDTIPLGTDLDPNAYNNTWAAEKIADEHGKVLFTHNISKRILDAENLGYTYGQRVHQKDKHFDVIGVKKAVEYFLKDGVHVVVVGKRPSMCKDFESEIASGLCEVLIADDSDDVFILKKAFESRCPIVSRDYFRKQQVDLRIDPALRRWCTDVGSKMQVKFAFDKQGTFIPDYDHQMPVLRPLRSQRWRPGQKHRER